MPWYSLLILVMLVLMGLFIGQAAGVLVAIVSTGYRISQLPELISEPFTNDKRIPIYLLQGFGTLGGFIAAGMVYLRYLERVSPISFFRKNTNAGILLASVIMVISFMFANTWFIDWNANITFPHALKGFETWARGKEDAMKDITDFLTRFTSLKDFIIGFVVVAILPAFAEEFLFRGIIQNRMEIILKNGHTAVWLTAILFSAFHFQFFGFLPRMMLGVLFGYMYYWSRNLWFPVLAHFLNNGFTLVMIYLFHLGVVPTNIEEEKALPVATILAFAFVGFVLLIYFRQYFLRKTPAMHE